jgi:phosphatidate cytidylyltransferase
LFFIITLLGLWEFYVVSEKGPNEPQKIMGTVMGGILFLCNAFIGLGYFNFPLLIIIIPLLYLIFITQLYLKNENPFRNIAFTLLGIFYVAVPFSMLNYIVFHKGFYDCQILLGFFLILWANDTGAYLVGSRIGKNKMFERVSPGKTWEGTIGGGVFGILTACFISYYFTNLALSEWLVIACLLVTIGTVGDLVQSTYKRSKNIKDSGSILPGHGGILDRFDSLLLATPFVFTYLFILRYFH